MGPSFRLIFCLEMPRRMPHTGRVKNQITVRGMDAETNRRVRDLARRQHLSMNKAAVFLIRRGAGMREEGVSPETVGDSLDAFIGSWSREAEARFLRSIRDVEQIDEDLWR
jgi:hypothetical protein